MTCRFDRRVIGRDRAILHISGRIAEEDVDTLGGLLEQEKGVVAIDLKGVLIVDREAIKLLAVSESNGVELRNCPAYIREWVTRETADRNTFEERTKRSKGTEDA
jgi:hypothetical protein